MDLKQIYCPILWNFWREGIDKLSIIKVSIDRTILSVKIFLFFVLHVNDLQMV